MPGELVSLTYSLLSGAFAFLCLYFSMTVKEWQRTLYTFFLVFTIAAWSGMEWAFWLMGQNMFDIILYPAVPLDFFFLSWIVFAGWYGEKIKARNIWIGWLIVLAIIFAIARVCMNCVKF